jgi:hypothetical protein
VPWERERPLFEARLEYPLIKHERALPHSSALTLPASEAAMLRRDRRAGGVQVALYAAEEIARVEVSAKVRLQGRQGCSITTGCEVEVDGDLVSLGTVVVLRIVDASDEVRHACHQKRVVPGQMLAGLKSRSARARSGVGGCGVAVERWLNVDVPFDAVSDEHVASRQSGAESS